MAPNYSANDSHSTPPIKSTAVAIDKDKNSPYAVRWAIDHLMVISNPLITLIHVRPKTNHLNQFLQRAPMMLITQPNLKTTVSSSHTADIVLVKGFN